MRSKLCFCISIFLLLACAAAPAAWHSSPAGGGEITTFAADSAGHRMFLSTQYAGVWLSNDGGITWEAINSRMSSGYVEVNHVDIPDAQGMIILTDAKDPTFANTPSCFSADGGETWHGSIPHLDWGYGHECAAIQAWRADPAIWFCMMRPSAWNEDYGYCYRSSDQGVTWDTTGDALIAQPGCFFQDPFRDSVLYFGTSEANWTTARIKRSTDLGATWTTVAPLYESGVHANHTTDMVRLSNGRFIATVNYSLNDFHSWRYGNWNLAMMADSNGGQCDVVPGVWDWDSPQHVLEDKTSPGTVILTGSCVGGAMRSTDYGQTWQRSLPGLPVSRQLGTWLYQNPHGGAIYVGISGFGVYRSTDHGATWQVINTPSGESALNWSALLTATEDAVYYQPGVPLRFYDSMIPGKFHRWELESPFTGWRYISNLPAMHDTMFTLGPVMRKAGDSLFCYAGYATNSDSAKGTNRTAFSADNGQSWVIGPPANDTLDATFLQITDENNTKRLFARGPISPFPLLMSTDEGLSWTHLARLPSSYVPIRVVQNQDTLYVQQGDGVYYAYEIDRSTNMGQNWDTLRVYAGYSGLALFGSDLFALFEISSHDLRVWRWSHGVWEQRGPLPSQPSDFSIPEMCGIPGPNPRLVFAWNYADSVIYTSADSGMTWDRRPIEFPGMNQSMVIQHLTWDPYRQRLWAVTGLGICYADDYQLRAKNKPLLFKPADYTVLSCYPNPFNNACRIRFDLLKQEKVKLDLYDLQGRHVQTLVDEVRNAGKQEIAFDGDGLASGTYFVQLSTSTISRTEKLLLLK